MGRISLAFCAAILALWPQGSALASVQDKQEDAKAFYAAKDPLQSERRSSLVAHYQSPRRPSKTLIAKAIWQASEQTGVDYQYLVAQAQIESGLDPDAKAPTSSATGLFQFIESTWVSSAKRYAARSASESGGGAASDSLVRHARSGSRNTLLELRKDPQIASLLAASFAQDNSQALHRVLGRAPSNSELYLAHFLGVGGAAKFLRQLSRNPGANAARLFPDPARANRPIFYTRSGRPRSLVEVFGHFDKKMKHAVKLTQGLKPDRDSASENSSKSYINSGFNRGNFHQYSSIVSTTPAHSGIFSASADAPAQSSAATLQNAQLTERAEAFRSTQDGRVASRNARPAGSAVRAHSSSPAAVQGRPDAPSNAAKRAFAPRANSACNHIEMCYPASMNTSTITQVRNLVASKAHTKAGIARAAGLHANTLRDCMESNWNPTSDTLNKLSTFLMAQASSQPALVSILEIINEARNGRMYILVDDEDRENEGDLVIPAQMATPDAINFMATHGRGLICLSLDRERVDALGLQPMSHNNKESMQTAFTTSIEAKEGVTTGISAADRARTISVAIDATKGPDDIVSPGHVFPLTARRGGVLVRAGHTEAAVDISRLAGLNPSGVICEIMNEDGTMARLDDLMGFAQQHNLKIGTIRDLIEYRMRNDHLVECVDEQSFESDYGGQWKVLTYRNSIDGSEQYVLQKGHVIAGEPTLARVHPISVYDDILGRPGARKRTLQRAMQAVGEHGAGVIVIITGRPASGKGYSEEDELRNVGIGSQILADLGVEDMILLSNSQPNLVAIEGYGLNITGHHPIPEV